MNLMRARWAVLAAAALLALLAPAVPAQPVPLAWPVAVQGQPTLAIHAQAAYYVWYDAAGWHVRWTTPFPQLCSGTITSNGAFSSVHGAGVFTVGQRVAFAHVTFGGTNGLDFQTAGTAVTFSLSVNQGLVSPAQVFLGRTSVHPPAMPFVVAMEPIQAQWPQRSGRPDEMEHMRELRERNEP